MNNMSSESAIVTTSEKWITNSDLANQVISKYTTNTKHSTGIASNKRKMPSIVIAKDDEEYAKKRERNNVAVKKSREKAKNRIQETQIRVEQLSKENEELQTKVTLLSKELNVLRALFTNGGFTLPAEFQFADANGGSENRHSPSMADTTVGHRMDEPPSRQPHTQHSSALSIKQEASKSAFHSMEESKIPPLRPMPRVANSSPNQKSELHSPIRSYDGVLQSSRDSMYSYKSGSHYSSSDTKQPPPIVMIQHGQSATTHSTSPYSSSHYKSLSEMQHTSVIRSSSEVAVPNSVPSQNNTLGKFCIIQDPENNGQVKIVPINS